VQFGLVAIVCLHTTMTAYGSGRHMKDIPDSYYYPRYAMGAASRLVYLPTAALVRISVLLFMRKLSPHRLVQYATFILISFNIFAAVFLFLLLFLQCSPAHVFFQPYPLRGPHTCLINELKVSFAIPLMSVIFDVLVWLVPLTIVLRLKFLEWKKKLVLMMLLGMGLWACIAAIMRLLMVGKISRDQSWEGAWMCMWNV
jgi:hypothetical protein